MDVEKIVAAYLAKTSEMPSYVVIPRDRPQEFSSVEITSTSGNRFLFEYVLAVQVWAKTRKRACELANKLAKLAQDLDIEDNIFNPKAEPPYSFYDEDSREVRYQFVLQLKVCN